MIFSWSLYYNNAQWSDHWAYYAMILVSYGCTNRISVVFFILKYFVDAILYFWKSNIHFNIDVKVNINISLNEKVKICDLFMSNKQYILLFIVIISIF